MKCGAKEYNGKIRFIPTNETTHIGNIPKNFNPPNSL
jgi:hypothetical protein